VPEELKKVCGYMWHPDNSDNQWWVDAFTIEPTSLLTHSTVISKRGMKQDAVENQWPTPAWAPCPR
jgi:rhamnogalacturonyl hydrolase YesR